MRKIEGMIGCRREDAPEFRDTTIKFDEDKKVTLNSKTEGEDK